MKQVKCLFCNLHQCLSLAGICVQFQINTWESRRKTQLKFRFQLQCAFSFRWNSCVALCILSCKQRENEWYGKLFLEPELKARLLLQTKSYFQTQKYRSRNDIELAASRWWTVECSNMKCVCVCFDRSATGTTKHRLHRMWCKHVRVHDIAMCCRSKLRTVATTIWNKNLDTVYSMLIE